MPDTAHLIKLATYIRYLSLISTTEAGSGHPTSSLSAADLMTGLLFSGLFRFDADNPDHPNNDRLIFSKGHASPLFYALWAAAGKVSKEEMLTLRDFESPLEGHPTPRFRYTEAATGSLGQGLSVGVGMALNAKIDKLPYRSYILLGDSEMAEGSVWEAIELAAYYELDNLVGIIDVNRLGQRGETMFGHDVEAYKKRVAAFGWETITIDGHSFDEILEAYQQAQNAEGKGKPVMIIAKTLKGKGVSFLEDKNGFHGKAVSKEELEKALVELGEVDESVRAEFVIPEDVKPETREPKEAGAVAYTEEKLATRKAYGKALARLFPKFPDIVVLDGEVSNSTYSEDFKEAYPERFFEMFIAEQNMVGTALGLARRGKKPFVSTFAAFFTRAFDQIRMAQYSDANITFVGSHAGVSIGEDGSSQMGLEDLAMFRTILDGVVLYPSDIIAMEHLVEQAAQHTGMLYIRTTRKDTPVIYDAGEEFPIGGSKVLRKSDADAVTVVAAGITLHEALAAADELSKEGVAVRVIDLYSVQPLDREALQQAADETQAVITVEDHYPAGGIGEAVAGALADHETPVHMLAVTKTPRSGTPQELLDFEGISKDAIVKKVRELIG